MKMLKFQTEQNKTLYVPLDHLASIYDIGNGLTLITLSNRMEWEVIGPPDYIVQKIMEADNKNDNIQDNKVEEPPINR